MSQAKRWFCRVGGCLERGPRGGPEFRGCLRRNVCFHVPRSPTPARPHPSTTTPQHDLTTARPHPSTTTPQRCLSLLVVLNHRVRTTPARPHHSATTPQHDHAPARPRPSATTPQHDHPPGRPPLLLRPASELNRILNSSWLRAPHVSIATSSRASYAFRQLGLKIQISSARIRRPRARRPTTQLNPQRNRAQHSSAQHGKFHVSTARRSTAPGTVHRHRHLQHCNCPSHNQVS